MVTMKHPKTRFYGKLIACAISFLFGLERCAEAQQPNVLFLFADDWGRYASAYAKYEPQNGLQSLVRTPNIDRIAKRGVLFRNAFVSAPSCTPCRSALLSGQHFWRTGQASILQGARWDSNIPAFPLLLHQAGYHIGESFKVWGPGTPGDAPYGAGKFAYEKTGRRINDFSENVTKMIDEGASFEDAKQTLLDEMASNFDQFLSERPEGKPFCYWYGPTNVHRQWVQGSGKKLWGFNPDDFEGKLPPFLPDVPIVREDMADYFGEIAAYDASVGVLLDRLEASGLADSTMVIVSGDHGPPGFPHGKCNLYGFGTSVTLAISGPMIPGDRIIDDLVSLTDLAPTILESAGLPIPSNMTGKSLLSMLRSDRSGKLDQSRTAIFVGRERHVESARADWTPYPQRAIRTEDYLFIINFRPDRWPLGDPYGLEDPQSLTYAQIQNNTRATHPDEDAGPTKAWLVTHRDDPQWRPFYERAYGKRPREELYDLRKDPQQMDNVAGDLAYAKIRRELEDRLMQELTSTGDPRVQENGKFYETPPMTGPLEQTSQAPRGKSKKP
jgi:arylsulfatase A-like enzyme